MKCRPKRKTRSERENENNTQIEEIIRRTDDIGIGIEETRNEKGRAVIATKELKKGDLIVEYTGELLAFQEAKMREAEYARKGVTDSFMYFFKFKENNFCIDATTEDGRLGRLLNHSAMSPNCGTKVVWFGGKPRLILFAKKDISERSELVFDYGERRKKIVEEFPWLRKS